MTEQAKDFYRHYVTNGFNGTQAAVDAKYSEHSAHAQACRLLKDAEGKEYLSKLVQESLENTKFKLEKVIIDKCFAIITANVTDYIGKDGFLTNWDDLDKRPIKNIKRKLNAKGDETIEVELHDPKPYIDLLSKYIDLAGAKDASPINIIYLDRDADAKGF